MSIEILTKIKHLQSGILKASKMTRRHVISLAISRWLCALGLLVLGVSLPAQAQRVALLIGNASYAQGRLTNPPNDVAAMEAALKRLNFKVQTVQNANQNQMKRAVRDFGSSAQGAEVAFMYYSGHGIQANGENYLLPVGASIEKESDYGIEAIAANDVLQQIRGARPKAAILVLDACRDNPLSATTRSTTKGLGRMDAPTGTMIAFATAPNTVASDNGDYAKVLAKELQKPGQELIDVFRNTTSEVRRLSSGKQEPRISEMSISERLYLAGPGTQMAGLSPEPTGRPSQSDPEEDAWLATKAANSVAAYDAYLAEYPRGRYAGAARIGKVAAQGRGGQPAQNASGPPQRPTESTRPVQNAPASAGQVIRDCDMCPEIVVIPGGSFQMGSNESDDEKPIHPVNVKSFLLGKTEVTQGQWKAVMGTNPSRFAECGDNCPVERVSWQDAQDYIQKLNARSGKQYRLPSEAEWEYAARAGSRGIWSFGDDESQLLNHAWFVKNSGGKTQLVGQKQANAFGLYDMHGNVWEWVEDCLHESYNRAPDDGSAWLSGCVAERRMSRGGSWNVYPEYLRLVRRRWNTPVYRDHYSGLRIARTIVDP